VVLHPGQHPPHGDRDGRPRRRRPGHRAGRRAPGVVEQPRRGRPAGPVGVPGRRPGRGVAVNRAARRTVSRLLMGAWLLALWLLLWGRIDALTLAGGVVVAAAAYWASRLPAVPLVRKIRPLRVVVVVAEFLWDLLWSSIVIGWHAVYRPGRVRSAIVDVEMRSRSPLVLLGVATSISLRPGTILIDLPSEREVLRIHAMPVHDQQDADAKPAGVEQTEARLMRAFVTWEDSPPEEDR